MDRFQKIIDETDLATKAFMKSIESQYDDVEKFIIEFVERNFKILTNQFKNDALLKKTIHLNELTIIQTLLSIPSAISIQYSQNFTNDQFKSYIKSSKNSKIPNNPKSDYVNMRQSLLVGMRYGLNLSKKIRENILQHLNNLIKLRATLTDPIAIQELDRQIRIEYAENSWLKNIWEEGIKKQGNGKSEAGSE